MEYSETGITGNDKELTRTFDIPGQVVDLPDTVSHAFIDLALIQFLRLVRLHPFVL